VWNQGIAIYFAGRKSKYKGAAQCHRKYTNVPVRRDPKKQKSTTIPIPRDAMIAPAAAISIPVISLFI
jgi:hypothetical protein